MLGVLVNVGTVIVGSLLGALLKKGIPERISKAVMSALGLCVVFIGISSAFKTNNAVILVASVAFGTFVGALIKIEDNLNRFSRFVESKFARNKNTEENIVVNQELTEQALKEQTPKKQKSSLAEGFVSGTLVFCVGAMTIVGSIEAGLSGDNHTLYVKAVMDLVSSFVLASTLGIGVIFSSIVVLLYQGALVLLAGLLKGIPMGLIAEITGAGGIMIMAIGINLTGITKFKVADMLPAFLFVVPFYYLFTWIGL